MSTDKTPLHAVVSVICDCLVSLSSDDQARALEAARVSLGLRAPVAQVPREATAFGERATLPDERFYSHMDRYLPSRRRRHMRLYSGNGSITASKLPGM